MKISIPLRSTARAFCALAVVAAFAACGDDNGGTGPNVGSITISVTSAGVGVDSAGYIVTVDNGDGENVAANGDISLSATAGSHSVKLDGVGSNCTVDGENPRSVDVVAGDDVEISFQVTCVARTIAFASARSGSFAIYTIREDGSGLERLTNDAAPLFATFPDWSPDGSELAFSSNRERSTVGLDIWGMDANGANPTRLTDAPGQNGRAAWSHDGTRIAFTSTRDSNSTTVAEIWVMDADGGNQRALTSDGKFANSPSWSPDDSRIVFQSNRDGTDQLYVMSSDGSGLTRLTNGAWGDQEPSWSPDGSLIAFQSTRDATAPVDNSDFEVYVMNADGSSPERLTDNSAFDGRATWSPSGDKLIFDSRRDGNEEVYVMNRDGSGQVNVTHDPGEDGFARFRP